MMRVGQAFPFARETIRHRNALNARVTRVVTIAFVACAFTVSSCSSSYERPRNLRPPALGVPGRVSEVSGIYKTRSQNTWQLRADGSFVLVTTELGATNGTFTLQDGRMEVRTPSCAEVGTYMARLTGEQKPNKDHLELTVVNDPCAPRVRALTLERWTYVES